MDQRVPVLRERIRELVFESSTPAARLLDSIVLLLILLSMACVILESMHDVAAEHSTLLRAIEWIITVAFTVEYAARLYSARDRRGYALGFYGVVDFVSTLPTYLSLLFPGAESLLVVRGLRLMRVFRVLGLGRFTHHNTVLKAALAAAAPKVVVFLGAIVMIAVILGTLMYLVEGPQSGIDNIPKGMYWAVSTLTTVGYGDVIPQSPFGRFVASVVMVLGYGIVAVPVGIVSSEITQTVAAYRSKVKCDACDSTGHGGDAVFCRSCGAKLPEPPQTASGLARKLGE
jgi:voltage-gated potassium channel